MVLTKLKHPKSQFKPPLKDNAANPPKNAPDTKITTTNNHLKQQTLSFPTKSSLERQSPEHSLSSESSSDNDETQDKKSLAVKKNNTISSKPLSKPTTTTNTSTTPLPIRKPFKTPFKTPFKDDLKPSSTSSVVATNKQQTKATISKLPQKKVNASVKESDSESSVSDESNSSSDEEDEEEELSSEEEKQSPKPSIAKKPNQNQTSTTPQKKPLLLKKIPNNPKIEIVNSSEKVEESNTTNKKPSTNEIPIKPNNNSQQTNKQSVNTLGISQTNTVETQSKVQTVQSSSLSLSLENEMDKQTQNKTSQISVDKPKDYTDNFIVEISDSSMSPILLNDPPKNKSKKKKNITFKAIESLPTQIEIADSILYEELLPPKKTSHEEEPKWRLKKKQEQKEEHVPKQIKISKFFKKEPHEELNTKPLPTTVNRPVHLTKKRKEKSTPAQSSPSVVTPVSVIKSPEMKKVKPTSNFDGMNTDTPEKVEQSTPKLFAMELSPVTSSILSILDSEESQSSSPVLFSKPKQSIVDESSRESLLPWSQSSQIDDDSQMITFSPVHNLKSDDTQIDEITPAAQKKSSMSLSPLIDIIGSNNHSQQAIMLDFDDTQIPDTPTNKINLFENRNVKIKEEFDEFDEESTSVDFSEKVSITPPLTTKREAAVGFLTLPYSIDLGGTVQDTELPTITHNLFALDDQSTTNPFQVQPKKPIKAKAFGRRQKVSFRPVFKEPTEDEEVKPKAKVEESVMNLIASHMESQNQTKSDSSNSFGELNNDILRTPPSFNSPELSL